MQTIIAPGSARFQSREAIAPSWALFALLLLDMFLSPELFSGVAVLAFLWLVAFSPARSNGLALRLMAPFLFLFILGLVMSSDNVLDAVLRDVWYSLKLCVSLGLGFLLGMKENNPLRLQRCLLIFAFLASAGTLLGNFANPFLAEGEVVALPLSALAAIPPLLDRIRWGQGPRRWALCLTLLLLVIAAFTSESRVTLIGIVIMGVAWAGMFATLKRTLLAAAALSLVGLALWQFLPEYNGGELTTLTKLRRSFEEMSFTDSYDSTSMIFNWRGYEAYNASLMFEHANFWTKIFGHGLGAEIDLSRTVEIGRDMSYQFLPTIHNGYYYLLIKFGVLGLVTYLLAVLSWLMWQRRNFDALNREDRILRGLIGFVLASTAVITGLYNKEELNGVVLLIAYLVAFSYVRHARSLEQLEVNDRLLKRSGSRASGASSS